MDQVEARDLSCAEVILHAHITDTYKQMSFDFLSPTRREKLGPGTNRFQRNVLRLDFTYLE